MRGSSFPIRVCSVCRHWRVALSAASSTSKSWEAPIDPVWLPASLRAALLDSSHMQTVTFAAKAKKSQPLAKPSLPSEDITPAIDRAERQMQEAVDRLGKSLTSVRSGRASPGLLDHLPVLAYGERMSLQSLASVSVQDAQTLIVTPFDPQTIAAISKGILDSPLQLSPKAGKAEIVVPVPSPSQETLKAMGKMVRQEAESARVAVRQKEVRMQARKDALSQVKQLASEDEARRAESQVQKLADRFVEVISTNVSQKEVELSKAL